MNDENGARRSVAIYWDFENLHAGLLEGKHGEGAYAKPDNRFKPQEPLIDVQSLVDLCASLGDIAIHRAYGNWQFFGRYRDALLQNAVDLVQLFPPGASAKNGADIRLCLDAADDISRFAHIGTVVIIGGDSDFMPVAQRIRAAGRTLIGIGTRKNTNRHWARSCHAFHYYDSLAQRADGDPASQAEPPRALPAAITAAPRRASLSESQELRMTSPQQSSAVAAQGSQTPPDRTSVTDDAHVEDIIPLPPPEHLIRFFPIRGTPVEALVTRTRQHIARILHGNDDRLLVIMGPCSIHDPQAALDYARRLMAQRERFADSLEIVMRVYFEKPRTTVGWKGLINDPYLDESYRIDEGLRIARSLLLDINRLGLPAAGEFLDVISPQYIGDLICWGAIGARTTESQVHRELASGISAPIGFKNGTDGNIKIAIDAIQAASRPHHFLGVHKNGQVATVHTQGNPDCHVILRGGKTPNYDAQSVAAACKELEAAGLGRALMVDCSHANSSKQHQKQIDVADAVAQQVASGSASIFGVMVESHLVPGAQKFTPGEHDPAKLAYGQSITDACIGWDDSVAVLETLANAVRSRRAARGT